MTTVVVKYLWPGINNLMMFALESILEIISQNNFVLGIEVALLHRQLKASSLLF